jgi:hypothetical protein
LNTQRSTFNIQRRMGWLKQQPDPPPHQTTLLFYRP